MSSFPPPPPQTAVVPIKSAWLSKINWTQVVSFIAMAVTLLGFNMPAEVQAAILAAITAITTIVTWAFRTFANGTVNPESIKP